MVDNEYNDIDFVHFQRVTYQDMNYIQTMKRLVEGVRQLDALPLVSASTKSEIVYLNGDNKLYWFNGVEWATIGDVKLPISDSNPLLKNETDDTKLAQFDLSLINANTTRIYRLPDGDGIIALVSDLPTIGGTKAGAVLYRENAHSAGGQDDVIIGINNTDDYINITESSAHTGDVIRYTDKTAEVDFLVENTGRVIARRMTLFSGGDG